MTHEKWEWDNAVLFTGTEGEIRIARGKLETTPASIKSKIIGDTQKQVYKSIDHYKDFLNAVRTRTKQYVMWKPGIVLLPFVIWAT
jgi:hypothetical protein